MNTNNYWEDEVYKERKQWNEWPYPEVLSALSRLKSTFPYLGNRLIEIGSGVGNNVIPIARYGMDCYGIDISETAILEARARAKAQNLSIQFATSDAQKMNFDSDFFDYVLDRSVLTCTDEITILNAVEEIYRVLKPGGVFFAFDWFGKRHPHLNYGRQTSDNTYAHFSMGNFKNVQSIFAFDFESLNFVLKEFDKIDISKITTTNRLGHILEEKYNFIAVKAC